MIDLILGSVTFPRRLCQCIINRPARLDPVLYKGVMDHKFGGPLRKSFSFAHEFNNSVIPFVPVLFCGSNPSAILRGVSRIIVDSVNRMVFGRLLSHVFQECNKRIVPSFANSQPYGPISGIRRIIGVVAPSLNSSPCFIFRAIGQSVGCFVFRGAAAPFAPATFRLVPGKVSGKHLAFSTAVTGAVPVTTSCIIGDCPLAKSHPDEIFGVVMHSEALHA